MIELFDELMGDPMENPFAGTYYTSDDLQGFGFHAVGKDVSIAKNCVIHGLGNIALGNRVRIDQNTTIIATSGTVEIGSFVHIGCNSFLGGASGIRIGDFTSISQHVAIYTASADYVGGSLSSVTIPPEFSDDETGPVVIGRHVILGCGCVVLPGAIVDDGCSVGALSLVKKSTRPWGVYAGIPVRRIKERDRAILDREEEFRARRPDLFDDSLP